MILKNKRLSFLKNPLIVLFAKGYLSSQEYARIKKITHNKKSTKKEIYNLVIEYLDRYEIPYKIPENKKYPDRTVAKRVKKYHEKKRDEGYKMISAFLSEKDFKKFQKIKQKYNKTNAEVLSYLLNKN
jgi:GT2 family glycosyltransferase